MKKSKKKTSKIQRKKKKRALQGVLPETDRFCKKCCKKSCSCLSELFYVSAVNESAFWKHEAGESEQLKLSAELLELDTLSRRRAKGRSRTRPRLGRCCSSTSWRCGCRCEYWRGYQGLTCDRAAWANSVLPAVANGRDQSAASLLLDWATSDEHVEHDHFWDQLTGFL